MSNYDLSATDNDSLIVKNQVFSSPSMKNKKYMCNNIPTLWEKEMMLRSTTQILDQSAAIWEKGFGYLSKNGAMQKNCYWLSKILIRREPGWVLNDYFGTTIKAPYTEYTIFAKQTKRLEPHNWSFQKMGEKESDATKKIVRSEWKILFGKLSISSIKLKEKWI